MAENTGVAAPAAPVDTSPSLTSFVGEMYGDYRDSGETEPESSQGTPPAATPDPAPSSEGTEPSVPTDTPSVEADPASVPDTGVSGVPAPAPDIDPFDGAQPFTYQVDKEARAFEGIQVLKDGTAIIEKPETVQHLQRLLGERDHLFAKDQASYRKYADLERLSAWQTRDGQGKDVTITGGAAIEASRVALSSTIAKVQSYEKAIDALTDPQKFQNFFQAVQGEDGQMYILPNKAAFEELKREAGISAREYALATRQHLARIASAPPPPPPEQPASELAIPTIDAFAQQHQITGLTPEDKQTLAGQFELYVRVENGRRVVDQRFLAAMKHTAALRAQQTKVAAVASTAGTSNAAKIAAASVGKRAANAPRIPPTKEPERTRENDFDDAWDRQQRAAAGALRAQATR